MFGCPSRPCGSGTPQTPAARDASQGATGCAGRGPVMEPLPAHGSAAAAAGPRPAPVFLHVPASHMLRRRWLKCAEGRGCGRTLISGSPAGLGAATRRPALLDGRTAPPMAQDKRPAATPGRSWFLAAPDGGGKRRDVAVPLPLWPRITSGAQMAAAADCNRERRRFRRRTPHAWFGPASMPPPQLIPQYSLDSWMPHARTGPGSVVDTARSRGAHPARGTSQARADRPLRAWRAPCRTCKAPASRALLPYCPVITARRRSLAGLASLIAMPSAAPCRYVLAAAARWTLESWKAKTASK